MPSFMNKLTGKSKKESTNEPTFGILPHPAKTNDPADLRGQEPPQPGGGLQYNNPEQRAFHATGPQIPTQGMMNNLPPPKTREELRARAAELNGSK